MSSRTLFSATLFLLLCLPATAQVEKVLFPVVMPSPQPGAHGSLWRTTLLGWNNGDERLFVSSDPAGCFIPCLQHAGPRSGFEFPFGPGFGLGGDTSAPGLFLHFRPSAEHLTATLRVHDISRQEQTWGTELPVVRESDIFIGAPAQLIGVPTDSRFRVHLRVYDWDGRNGKSVRMRIYPFTDQPFVADLPSEAPVLEPVVEMVITTSTGPVDMSAPGFAQISDLVAAFPQLAGFERLRVELSPVESDLRFWGFISVTNNETQHVTVISPE